MTDITVTELKQRLDAGEQLTLIDVREPYEYEEYNLGARLIPLGDIPVQAASLADKKDEEIIIHCRSGKRSAAAQNFLQQQGFTKVRNLIGGVLAYQQL